MSQGAREKLTLHHDAKEATVQFETWLDSAHFLVSPFRNMNLLHTVSVVEPPRQCLGEVGGSSVCLVRIAYLASMTSHM